MREGPSRKIEAKERRRAHPPERIQLAYLDDRKAQGEHILARVLQEVPVIGDRSFVGDIVYLQALDGIPAAETFALYRRHQVYLPELIVHVDAPPDTALANLAKRERQRKPHENPRQMRDLAGIYEDVLWGSLIDGLPRSCVTGPLSPMTAPLAAPRPTMSRHAPSPRWGWGTDRSALSFPVRPRGTDVTEGKH